LTQWRNIGNGAANNPRVTSVIGQPLLPMPQSEFTADQAVEIAAACATHQVEYLFIGKSGAILLG
jgi:hypothetical protein